MSSTRKAKDDSVFHQSRYASSPEFERGLGAYLVAKRAAILEAMEDRELIWFIQHLSHQEGGLAAVAKDLICKFSDRLQTLAMAKMGMKAGAVYSASQVKTVRAEIPREFASRFPLYGEEDFLSIISHPRRLLLDDPDDNELLVRANARAALMSADDEDESQANADSYPRSYPAQDFIGLCHEQANERLETYLNKICLDPASTLESGPWYFHGLIIALREHQAELVKTKSAGVVTTALGEKVCEVLNYTAYSRGLTLMQGEARLGKSFAARVWCEQHPGQARFVEVPPSNDEASFFRALARGLGIGNFLQYKVTEIRERVESVLLTGDLLLVLDEAHRLWPQRNLRYGFPGRINWLMAMANHNVPICCIATPQFIQWQKAAEEKGQWNSAQLTGRISHYESLPADLSPEDLMAVAKSVLPEANAQVLRALAVYARSSARYLAAIDSISKRARYIALRDGRAAATTADVRKAMQESVIPADTKLQRALESGRKGKLGKMTPATDMPSASVTERDAGPQEVLPVRPRESLALPGSRGRAGHEASLIEA